MVIGSKIFVGREQFSTAHSWVGGLTVLLSVGQVGALGKKKYAARALCLDILARLCRLSNRGFFSAVSGGVHCFQASEA